MVHCIIQKRYFMYGNLHLHQNLSLKIIFIFIYQILYSSSVNVKDIYFVIGFILSRSKIRPKFVKMVTQYMYLHPLSIFSTIYQKIYYSSFLVCMTRQKSTQSKSRPSCQRTSIWIILIVSQTAEQAERERENDRYLHIYFKAT